MEFIMENLENPIKMDDLVGFPHIFGNTQLFLVNDGILIIFMVYEIFSLQKTGE